jgi:hypothetical protein
MSLALEVFLELNIVFRSANSTPMVLTNSSIDGSDDDDEDVDDEDEEGADANNEDDEGRGLEWLRC